MDTHVLLWALQADPRISKTAKRILTADDDELVFSLVSLWETSIKMSLGKLTGLGSSVAYVRDQTKAYGMELVPVRFAHVLRLEQLPRLHGDPFDRMIIAQALQEGLPVLTQDKVFGEYGVDVIW